VPDVEPIYAEDFLLLFVFLVDLNHNEFFKLSASPEPIKEIANILVLLVVLLL
jgi:hypothetical protein